MVSHVRQSSPVDVVAPHAPDVEADVDKDCVTLPVDPDRGHMGRPVPHDGGMKAKFLPSINPTAFSDSSTNIPH